MEYKRSMGERFKTTFKVKQQALWSAVAVRRILQNELYIGVLEQGKRTTPNYKIKTRIDRPKAEWVRVENAYELIISKELFFTVSGLLLQDTRIAPSEETVYLFSGIITCGDCKENMIRKTVPANGKKYYYYTCSSNRSNKNSCTTHNISEKSFEEAVLEVLNLHIHSILDIERILQYIDTLPYKQDEIVKLDAQIVKAQEEIEKNQNYKLSSYEHFAKKVITKEEYRNHVSRYDVKTQKAEKFIIKRKKEVGDIVDNKTPANLWIEHFKQYQTIEQLTRKVVVSLIEKVLVYEAGKIEIHFKYQAEFESALRFIESARKSNLFDASVAFKEALLDIPCIKILMGTDGKNLAETKELYNLTEAEEEILAAKRRKIALN